MKKDNNKVVETKEEISKKVLSQYNACLVSQENNEEISKLHVMLKNYKLALRSVTKSINKACYNIDYTAYTEVESEALALFANNANVSRRSVVIACLNTQNCKEEDILKAINTYADIKYRNLTKANKKCISGTINDLRSNKALTYTRNASEVYTLVK